MKTPQTKNKVLIIPDIHAPYQDKKAIEILKKVATDLKPDTVVFLGDMIDCEHISKFSVKKVEAGLITVLDEIKEFKENVYNPILKACKTKPKVKICLGNHEQRIPDTFERLRQRNETEILNHWEPQLNFKKIFPDAEVRDYNDFFKIGKLNFTHGEFHGRLSHAKNHAVAYMENVVYGHTHTIQSYYHTTKGRVIKGVSIGTMSDIEPSYMKKRSSSWVNAFGVAYFINGGKYFLTIPEIINNTTVFNGKIYTS